MFSKKIAIIGAGYVGLTTGVCLASLGHSVICLDNDQDKIEKLKKGVIPIYEPGLAELLKAHQNNIVFTNNLSEAVHRAGVIFLAVGTPSQEDGSVDLSYFQQAVVEVAQNMNGYKVLVDKSTVPPGTANWVKKEVKKYYQGEFAVVSNPEFLREGTAIDDFLKPDRVVIGVDEEKAKEIMLDIYLAVDAPKFATTAQSAELIKYAANSFLAMKISFINEIANICEKTGSDVVEVAKGIGLDSRIGHKFLQAGVGFGGSCLLGSSEVLVQNKQGMVSSVRLEALFDLLKKQELKVLSFDRNKKNTSFNKIIRASKRAYKGEFVSVITKMNKAITTTSDHPFIVFEKNGLKVKLAQNLTISDRLVCFLGFPPSLKKHSINIIDHLSRSDFDYKKVKVRPLQKKLSDVGVEISKAFKAARRIDILRANCMNLEEFLKIEKSIANKIERKDLVLFTSKGSTTSCPAIINFDADFCRFLGYYVSEGNIHYENCLRGTRTRIQIHFNIRENEYFNDVKNILDGLNIKFRISEQPKNSTRTFVVSSRILAFLIDKLLNCGKDSYSADVPDEIFSLNDNLRKEFLKGVFRGDGHIAFPKNTNSVVYDFGSISYPLVQKMILLFHSLGIVPSYKRSRSEKSSDFAHFFRISTKKQIEQLRDFKDSFTQKKVDEQLKNCKDIKPCGFEKGNGQFCIVNIKAISKKTEERDVYSLEVDKINTFIADYGLIVHNCFPKDVAGLIHTALVNNYQPRILEAVMAVNKSQQDIFCEKIKAVLAQNQGRAVGIWGLAFKPNTDDIRYSPAIAVIKDLLKQGCQVKAYDPVAQDNARAELGAVIEYCSSAQEAAKGVDVLALLTDWPEFLQVDWVELKKIMRSANIIDGRNFLPVDDLAKNGFHYQSIGHKLF